jgi:hypothetical protein
MCVYIRDVQSHDDVTEILKNESVMDTLQRCGITAMLKVTTKDIIAQQVLTHEAIYKIAKLLDQFCEGLKKLHMHYAAHSFLSRAICSSLNLYW